MTNQKLWKKIKEFNLDEKDIDFTFSQRLARDNNWGLDFVNDVIIEYKKFIYLCCVSDQQITPSDSVDQAWHLHLTYTQSYWKKFCGETINKEIHHNPTKGGLEEKNKFSDCYDLTFEVYKSEFNNIPPDAIWLNNKRRFHEINFKRINTDSFWLIKKPSKNYISGFKLIIIGVLIPTLFIQAENSSSAIYFFIIIAAIILFNFFNDRGNKKGGDSGCSDGCSHFDDSGCSSGCSGCGGCGD